MKKEIEDLLKAYYKEGFRYLYMSHDDKLFVTKLVLRYIFNSKQISENYYCNNVAFLPIEELKDLVKEKRIITIDSIITVLDWDNVKKGTPVIVRRGNLSLRRYFKEYNANLDKSISVYKNGCTSWSTYDYYPERYSPDEVELLKED